MKISYEPQLDFQTSSIKNQFSGLPVQSLQMYYYN